MTAISSLPAVQAVVVPARVASTPAANGAPLAANASASPSSIVSLGQIPTLTDAQTYTARGLIADADVPPAWEYTQQDKVSLTMMGNFANSSSADRFRGLGASLLAQLAESGKGFSQSVIRSSTGSALEPAELKAAQTRLHSDAADNAISLTLKTASGKTVQLTLTSQANGLAVQAQVSGGDLSDEERAALGKMADGFQTALDGIAAVPPQLKLDALTGFDSDVFSSVNLSTRLKLQDGSDQTLELQADADQRTVRMSGAAGDLNLSVDMKNSALLGDSDQQARALKGYVSQIEAARKRGDGDAQLLSMFEDAFTALHSHYPETRPGTAPQTVSSTELTNSDHAMLTGLADFSASVTEKPDSSNPARPGELDTFAYELSQSTQTSGRNSLNRKIVQEQQSHLVASYHKPLYPGQKLELSKDPNSQNYLYYQVDDRASSKATIGYDKGALVNASVEQSASQSTRVARYVMGHLEEQTVTPTHATARQSFLSLINQALQPGRHATPMHDAAFLKDTLAGIHDRIMLQNDPASLDR